MVKNGLNFFRKYIKFKNKKFSRNSKKKINFSKNKKNGEKCKTKNRWEKNR